MPYNVSTVFQFTTAGPLVPELLAPLKLLLYLLTYLLTDLHTMFAAPQVGVVRTDVKHAIHFRDELRC